MNEPHCFDLILVYTSFRRHGNYANIIKGLAGKIRVGIIVFKSHKWNESEEKYLQLCVKYGATLVSGKTSCHTLMISRFGGYPGKGHYKNILEELPGNISYERLLLNVTTIMSGVLYLREICNVFGQPIILVPSKKYFGEYEKDTLEYLAKSPLEIVEVGMPYFTHKIFPDFSTDYILAYPSHVVIEKEWEHLHLLKNMVSVLRTLPINVKVVVKPHNVKDGGNYLSETLFLNRFFIPAFLRTFFLSMLRIFDIQLSQRTLLEHLPKRILQYLTRFYNDVIFSRCINLLNDFPPFGIEHFLHGVREGVISGLSNTILMAMVAKKPIYNIDDLPMENRSPNYKTINDKFNIQSWEGFSTEGFKFIDDSVRSADIIEYLLNTVKPHDVLANNKP